jgi:hypothetical protein
VLPSPVKIFCVENSTNYQVAEIHTSVAELSVGHMARSRSRYALWLRLRGVAKMRRLLVAPVLHHTEMLMILLICFTSTQIYSQTFCEFIGRPSNLPFWTLHLTCLIGMPVLVQIESSIAGNTVLFTSVQLIHSSLVFCCCRTMLSGTFRAAHRRQSSTR